MQHEAIYRYNFIYNKRWKKYTFGAGPFTVIHKSVQTKECLFTQTRGVSYTVSCDMFGKIKPS